MTERDEGRIIALTTDVAATVLDATQALLALADERKGLFTGLYRRSLGGGLVRPGHEGKLVAVDTAALRVLCHEAAFVGRFKPQKDDDPVLEPATFPADMAQATLSTLPALPELRRFPLLDHVSPIPLLLPSGLILQPGEYDADQGVLVAPGAPRLELPDALDQDAAGRAARGLCDLVAQFPWVSEHDCAAWLSFVLTLVGRELVAGPVPLTLVTGNVAGAGKTMLVDIASYIALGRNAPPMKVPTNPDEAGKTLLAVALGGQRLACLDNVVGTLIGGPLDAALTAGSIQGRILGASAIVEAPWKCVVAATGNNLRVGGDLQRRVLPLRLLSPDERPELRAGFALPDLPGHVLRLRAHFLSDCATVLVAWQRAGRPHEPSLTRWGSFQAWSDTIRQAVYWATGIDPCGHRLNWAQDADPIPQLVRVLLSGWPTSSTGMPQWLTSAELLTHLQRKPFMEATAGPSEWQAALKELLPKKAQPRPEPADIGYALRNLQNRTFGQYVLRSERGGHQNLARWCVEHLPVASPAP